jgi:ribosomal protein RSM22 (predicted rRNA methylase)
MIKVFEQLTDGLESVKKADIIRDKIEIESDFVMTSYVLSEMKEQDRLDSVEKLLKIANKYLLIIDTGTPRTYENMMTIKRYVQEKGYKVIAPCCSNKCGLKNDYCQFFARVERSALMKQAKAGELSYEDEKYFYLLIAKTENLIEGKRIIRRPVIKTNNIELVMCFEDGVEKKIFTKKDKELFKKAKKAKINDILN